MNHKDAVLAAASLVMSSADASWEDRKRIMVAFENTLLGYSNPDDADLMTELSPLFSTLNRLYERFETDLEMAFVKTLLSHADSLQNYLLFHRFETLVSNEANIAHLNPGDEVAMIGSGPLPITAILLAVGLGIKVTAMERDCRATELSRQVIRKCGLEKEIRVAMGDGQYLVAEGASCVIVAILAKPKDLILENVFQNYGTCTKVVCRTSHGIRKALYNPADPQVLNKYRQLCANVAQGDQTISSIVLEKRRSQL